LIITQKTVTVLKPKRGREFIDPGIWVSAVGSDLRLDVQRASYTEPVTVIIKTPWGTTQRRPLLPHVPTLANPPQAALPQLTALPSWGIRTAHTKAGPDLLSFSATVWVGGNSPLDVEGFRQSGSPVRKAYQYFWRNGKVIGRAPAGTMGFETGNGENEWHFEQFARYRLLTASKKLAVISHKVGFCIAPTDPVDMLIHSALWQPQFIGFGGACGSPSALWVQEYLPNGWGDTYVQSLAEQAFDITNVPNGTYYIEITVIPLHKLHELSTAGNTSLRKIILGGTASHRTVKVPAWHGIDPEP
jgi:hypothetical protein